MRQESEEEKRAREAAFKQLRAGSGFPSVIDDPDDTLFGEVFLYLYAKQCKVVTVFTTNRLRFRGRVTHCIYLSLTLQPVGLFAWLTRAKPINIRFKEIVAFK